MTIKHFYLQIIVNIMQKKKNFSWSTKAVISNTGIFEAIDNNTLYGSKLYIFYAKNH